MKLALVVGGVEVALRRGDESIGCELPFLEATEADAVAGAARAGVGANECPVIFDAIALNEDVVHGQMQIWKCRHESLHHFGDGCAPDSHSAIDS